MSPEQQLKHFNDHQNMQHGKMSGGRMNVVLRFVAGLTKLKCLSNHFLHKNVKDIYHNARVDINLLNWMFETQSNDVIELLLEHKIIEVRFDYMLPMDYYCLGYCIAHSQCQWMLRMDNDKMDEEMVSMLVTGVNTIPECTGTVVGLRVNISTTVDCLNMLFSGLKTNLRLLSLYLQRPCDSNTWPDLSELRELELFIADIEPTNRLDTLLSKLSLESLTITGYCNGRDILHYEDCVAITHHLKTTSTLKHINISAMNFHNVSGLLLLLKALQDHPTLQQKNIKNLRLDGNINGDDEAKDWAQLYEEYSHLMNGTVEATGISDAGAVALAQALHDNSTVQELNLSNNSISDAGAVALAQAVHHNSTLKCLRLHGNNAIGEEGTCALIEALTVNTSITIECIFAFFGLVLPTSCEQYATQCPQYDKVKNRIFFSSNDVMS